ncbi:hypothetical protein [Aquitalea pelogenes]
MKNGWQAPALIFDKPFSLAEMKAKLPYSNGSAKAGRSGLNGMAAE